MGSGESAQVRKSVRRQPITSSHPVGNLLPMPLPLADAQKVVHAAIAHATKLGIRVSVAVVDQGAHLIVLERMDGAPPISPQIAEGKAVGAAMFIRDGASLLTTANDRPAFFNAVSGMARTRMVPGP